MKNPRFYKVLSAWLAFALAAIWLLMLVAVHGLLILESIFYYIVVIGTLGIILLIYPSLREEHDQAMVDFFHYGYGLLGSSVALAIMIFALIRVLKGKCGSWTQGLLVFGAALQLVVFEWFSLLTAVFYVLAAFLPEQKTAALEKQADESVQ
ncbi:hypothetical protein GKS28_10175 [Bacillus paralicheniformis]|uniref:hypothetical protein n=1 Tax=Bacillus TaxID=1386 RepID=UPI0012B387CD|nr:hypothetical protein [Bacillus paralicheniformis]MSN99167.1 hypothetical protein [Bacillus paralicheniformis]MSO03175.1 hypothetical protein [Bacillus paralicheniformis]MSO07168.1 hypothetical protein [Bacillus paralicheniformis]MSO11162.1 hypothetical protein [Bacillus paralicheniformis]NJE35753.1 hypothetical protein [Bacillus paralicheniformis]